MTYGKCDQCGGELEMIEKLANFNSLKRTSDSTIPVIWCSKCQIVYRDYEHCYLVTGQAGIRSAK